jgi:DNA-binding GntR family transcriptional regulator
MTTMTRNKTLRNIKGMIAKIILQNALDKTPGKPRLAQRDMAEITGTDWQTVHASLNVLRDEGAIKIEGHRIIINKELLQAAIAAA